MKTTTKYEELLTQKELAAALKRHRSYVLAMTLAGFKGIDKRYLYSEALEWLRNNPDFSATKTLSEHRNKNLNVQRIPKNIRPSKQVRTKSD